MAEQVEYTVKIVSGRWTGRSIYALRPGMYIGKLGDGSAYDDGIYVLLKEIVDNSIDEFVMGAGRSIEVNMSDHKVSVRDYGRGIPLGKVIDCVSKINTGGKYDSKAFQKSVGLNGVGTKAVNALSTSFTVQSYRDGRTKLAEFAKGELIRDEPRRKPPSATVPLSTFSPTKLFSATTTLSRSL
jgi:topoisomerase-4 subunit B